MTEMVIPGTYIDVRAEGLIAVGGIATGTIGVVGTAGRGPVDEVRAVGSLTEALDLYGPPDPFQTPIVTNAPLTLTRTLEQAYLGGARNVLAVRIANGTPTPATVRVPAAGGDAFTLAAAGLLGRDDEPLAGSSGTWGRGVRVSVTPELLPDGSAGWRLTLAYRTAREVFRGRTVADLHAQLAASSLVTVGDAANPTSALVPSDAPLAGGTDGANVTEADLGRGLRALEGEPVNVLLVGGFHADTAGSAVQGHLQRTAADGREQVAVLGASDDPGEASSASDVADAAAAVSNERVVLVAPGIRVTDTDGTRGVPLPPAYLAAVVAGRLSALAPHVSLTNKQLPVALDVQYSTPTTQALLQSRVLVVRRKVGAQVVRGITSSPPPFAQITIRRIVDYAMAGVRRGADPYLGRLNNARVRAALQATLDGFLSQMVLDEQLVTYALEVTATRSQERAGVCSVVMTLQPTFSIDFIRVTMNLE